MTCRGNFLAQRFKRIAGVMELPFAEDVRSSASLEKAFGSLEMTLRPGKSILVVDDEPLLAMEMEDMLLAMEGMEVSTAYDLETGLSIVERQKLDFAVLDFNLGRETDSIPIAQRLFEKRVPFAFVTGNIEAVLRAFPTAPVVPKPIDARSLASLIPA